jgi:hypothetical protein
MDGWCALDSKEYGVVGRRRYKSGKALEYRHVT